MRNNERNHDSQRARHCVPGYARTTAETHCRNQCHIDRGLQTPTSRCAVLQSYSTVARPNGSPQIDGTLVHKARKTRVRLLPATPLAETRILGTLNIRFTPLDKRTFAVKTLKPLGVQQQTPSSSPLRMIDGRAVKLLHQRLPLLRTKDSRERTSRNPPHKHNQTK